MKEEFEPYNSLLINMIYKAESLAVSDIDFLDIVGKLLYSEYPKMRYNLLKANIDAGIPYVPTENGECRTTDVVFTPEEVKEILGIYRNYYEMLKEFEQEESAASIKKIHNDLIDNLELGGCWDETPEYITDDEDD